jgi:hypothetical protein
MRYQGPHWTVLGQSCYRGAIEAPGRGEMNWSKLGIYLSAALLAGAVAVAFAPIAIVIVAVFYNLRDWLKTGVRPPIVFANWYQIRLPHTSWAGLQRIFDWINAAPGPVVILCACVCVAILLLFLARLVAESARPAGQRR